LFNDIKGTLIITNTGNRRVRFQSSAWIEPGPLNYPVLLVDTNNAAPLELGMSQQNLSELTVSFLIGVNGIELTDVSNSIIRDLYVDAMKGTGILVKTSCSKVFVDTCEISGCDGAGISLDTCGVDNVVSKCYSATNNNGIELATVDRCTVTGNHCISNAAVGLFAYVVTNSNIDHNILSSNTQVGLYLYQCSEDNVSNNTSSDNGQTGITLYDTGHCNVIANNCTGNGTSSNAAYDNISLVGDSDYNNVQCNITRKGAAGNKPAYGLGIRDATCNANLCTNNDLYDGGVTGALNNSGTGTVTTAGNRVS
jgi:parallel beta-helix repeat protein